MPDTSVDNWLKKWSQEPSYHGLKEDLHSNNPLKRVSAASSRRSNASVANSEKMPLRKKPANPSRFAVVGTTDNPVTTPRTQSARKGTSKALFVEKNNAVNDTTQTQNTETLTLPPEELKKKRATARRWASVLPVLAAFAKALKDSFGAMCLYSLIFFGELKLTAALFNPWVAAVIVVLGIALFCISLGMEGKSLRQTILGWLSKRSGIDLTQDDESLQPVHGKLHRLGVYLAIGLCKLLKRTAPWTAALCKGCAGFGACAGCLLLLLAGSGVIASTALLGPIPWIVIGVSAILGLTTALVSRYKEGYEFIQNAEVYEAKCWQRLALPTKAQQTIRLTPQMSPREREMDAYTPTVTEVATPRNKKTDSNDHSHVADSSVTKRNTYTVEPSGFSFDTYNAPAKHPGLFRRPRQQVIDTARQDTTKLSHPSSAIQPMLVSTGPFALNY